ERHRLGSGHAGHGLEADDAGQGVVCGAGQREAEVPGEKRRVLANEEKRRALAGAKERQKVPRRGGKVARMEGLGVADNGGTDGRIEAEAAVENDEGMASAGHFGREVGLEGAASIVYRLGNGGIAGAGKVA